MFVSERPWPRPWPWPRPRSARSPSVRFVTWDVRGKETGCVEAACHVSEYIKLLRPRAAATGVHPPPRPCGRGTTHQPGGPPRRRKFRRGGPRPRRPPGKIPRGSACGATKAPNGATSRRTGTQRAGDAGGGEPSAGLTRTRLRPSAERPGHSPAAAVASSSLGAPKSN